MSTTKDDDDIGYDNAADCDSEKVLDQQNDAEADVVVHEVASEDASDTTKDDADNSVADNPRIPVEESQKEASGTEDVNTGVETDENIPDNTTSTVSDGNAPNTILEEDKNRDLISNKENSDCTTEVKAENLANITPAEKTEAQDLSKMVEFNTPSAANPTASAATTTKTEATTNESEDNLKNELKSAQLDEKSNLVKSRRRRTQELLGRRRRHSPRISGFQEFKFTKAVRLEPGSRSIEVLSINKKHAFLCLYDFLKILLKYYILEVLNRIKRCGEFS